jgi:N-methylhydantoinase B
MSFPGNTSAMPVEVLEAVTPIRVNHRRIRPDSGGIGRFRGGCGTDFEFESVSPVPLTVQAEHGKLETAPKGIRGGGAGATGATFLNGAVVPDKIPLNLCKGDVMRMLTPGSGGAYPASERDPNAVQRDIDDGVVTMAAAARDYNIVKRAKPRRRRGKVLRG